MTKGFVNLNRFKDGGAIKRHNKQRTDLPDKKQIRGNGAEFRWKDEWADGCAAASINVNYQRINLSQLDLSVMPSVVLLVSSSKWTHKYISSLAASNIIHARNEPIIPNTIRNPPPNPPVVIPQKNEPIRPMVSTTHAIILKTLIAYFR